MSILEKCLEASMMITRAEGGRRKTGKALKALRRNPRSYNALRDYVAATTQTEEAELAILAIKRELHP